eukprot:GHVS01080927.1.p1 GENE.GHVS01080927.1~~GHVS01080927.1.p1  ORF type:complete len:340 (-),score=30.84 GHVS01080927.1:94-1113(-)
MRPFFMQGHSRPITCVMFNTDGDLLFTAAKDTRLQVWRSEDCKRIGTYDCGKGVVWAFDVTKDCQRIIAASADQKILIFDVETGTLIDDIKEEGPCKFVEWCQRPDNQTKFVLAHSNFGTMALQAIKAYECGAEGEYRRKWVQRDYESPVTQVHWGPFDETIISCHEDGNMHVWCAETGELLLEGDRGVSGLGHKGSCTCCSFNEDRTLMLTCSKNGNAKLWDTAEWKERKNYVTDRPLNACAISPLYKAKGDRQRCHILLGGGQEAQDVTTTSASEGKFQALLYNMVFCEHIGGVKGHFGPINSMAWCPDGAGYCSGGEDGYVRMYRFDDDYFSSKYE